MFLKRSLASSLGAMCLIVAGCGDREASSVEGSAMAAKSRAALNAQKNGLDIDLVKASSSSKSGANVEMHFKLAARPEAGKAVGLSLVFIPPADDTERMTVSLQASDGLTIEVGEGPAIFVPSKGAPIAHQMSVKADHDGIYSVTAAVLLETANNSTASRSFSVPIIVGSGIQPMAQ